MTSSTYQKTVNASYLTGIASFIAMPDVVFGLLLELMHGLLELLHLAFEFVESTLDHLVEHIFHTGVHDTQVIVFYLLVTMALVGFYYLWRITLHFFRKLKGNLIAAWLQLKTRLASYWAEQSFFDKVKLFLIVNAGVAGILLFGF